MTIQTMVPRARRSVLMPCSLALLVLAGCATAAPRATPAGLAEAERVARAAIAREHSLRTAALPPRTVGVLPFSVAGADTGLAPLAYGLADLLLTDLARSAQLEVVERLTLDVLLRELDLARSGRVDTLTAPRVGRLVGARRLVVGVIAADAAERVSLTARVADVATGATTAGGTSTTALDGILDAEKALAFQLFDAMGVALTPRERALVEQRPTRNLAALLAYSRGVRDEAFGRYDAAVAGYRQALQLDPGFTLARTRLQGVGGGEAPGSSVRRAALGAAAGVAPTAAPAAAAAADPSFAGAQDRSATLIIRVRPTP